MQVQGKFYVFTTTLNIQGIENALYNQTYEATFELAQPGKSERSDLQLWASIHSSAAMTLGGDAPVPCATCTAHTDLQPLAVTIDKTAESSSCEK